MDEQTTPMRQAFVSLHEHYVEMRAVGFSRAEACMVLGTMLATAGMQRPDED